MSPKVTIIVPAYNEEQFIEKCAKSIINQTLKEIEIIFIDDGSTDRTGDILDKLAISHPNMMHIIHQENKGLYRSREIGLSLATGEYIGWVDADDFVEAKMYEVLYNTAIENESELVICNYNWYPQKIPTKVKWFKEYKGIVDVSFVDCNTQLWNKIVKRELIEKLEIGKYFTKCFDDIYIRILMEARNPITVNEPLYYYRVGNGSMSSSYSDIIHYRGFVESSKALRDVMQSIIINNSYWDTYFDYRVIYYLLITMIVSANTNSKEDYKRNQRELLSVKPRFNKNQFLIRKLKERYGVVGSAVIVGIIPFSYQCTRLACQVKLKPITKNNKHNDCDSCVR